MKESLKRICVHDVIADEARKLAWRPGSFVFNPEWSCVTADEASKLA